MISTEVEKSTSIEATRNKVELKVGLSITELSLLGLSIQVEENV